jgi:hypothetical protein
VSSGEVSGGGVFGTAWRGSHAPERWCARDDFLYQYITTATVAEGEATSERWVLRAKTRS